MARFGSKAWRNFDPSVQPVAEVVGSATVQGPLRILGLDPGSRRTGFGLIEIFEGEWRCLEHGRIEVERLPVAVRLSAIYNGVSRVLEQYKLQEAAIKLGQARGAALAALGDRVQLAEYAPRAIKLATVGFGAADKLQVAHMMHSLLKPVGRLSADAADALAVAVCHAQHRKLARLVSGVAG